MWNVVYERHHKYVLDRTSKFETQYYVLALFVFHWWYWCYIMNIQPVKLLSIFRIEDGITFIKGSKVISVNQEQLRKLKCAKKSMRRFWDYS